MILRVSQFKNQIRMFDSLGRCARVPVRETAGGVWMGQRGRKQTWGLGAVVLYRNFLVTSYVSFSYFRGLLDGVRVVEVVVVEGGEEVEERKIEKNHFFRSYCLAPTFVLFSLSPA